MPAVNLLKELIFGIEPIFVMRYDRRPLEHPISSIYPLNQGADPLKGEWRKRVRKTWMKALGAVTNLLVTNKQTQENQKG
jgi:hypothetical protein